MKSYLRFLSRNKVNTVISMVGLSVALTFVIIFTCYLRQQLAVCNHYPDSDKIYLVGLGERTHSSNRMAMLLRDQIPELEDVVGAYITATKMKYDGETIPSEKVLSVDGDFFNIFKTKIIAGNLSDFAPKSNVFVTESFARRYGMEDILGKNLVPRAYSFSSGSEQDGEPYTIAGIVEDFTNTVFADFEVIINYEENSYYHVAGAGILTFIKVKDGTDMGLLSQKISSACEKSPFMDPSLSPLFIRLDELYFSEYNNDRVALKSENSDRLIIFVSVVFFLLVSAVFNYININIANAERRAKEWAIRHVIGEDKGMIAIRAFVESLLFTSLSFIFALGAASVVSDWVNHLLQSPLPISISYDWDYILMYILIVAAIALICSVAVVLAISRHKVTSSTTSGRSITKLFIGIQFILSMVMISAALTMEAQMNHMVYRDMNANIDNIYNTALTYDAIPELASQLEELPIVRSIGRSISYPGDIFAQFDGVAWLECDSTAFKMFRFEKVADFNNGNPHGIWVTEAIANRYGISEDQTELKTGITLFDGPVAGIVKDFPSLNILQTHLEGSPVITVREKLEMDGYMMLEVEETNENKKILDDLVHTHVIKAYGKEIYDNGFLRDLTKADYEQTRKDMRMIEMFTFVAIVLSCLAFFAMSMHYADRSTKQVAVHKVFGGSTGSELMRNMAVYFKIMGISLLIATPAAIWICGRYLEQFSYRFALSEKWWIFLLAALISMSISTATVLWQTLRAARTNPAEALKKE